MSLTGTFQLILHKQNALTGSLAGLNYPLPETQDEWVMHGFSFANYLEELGPKAQQEIYAKSSIDLALRDAFRKMRSFLMTTKGVCTENSNPDVVMVKSAQNGVRTYEAGSLEPDERPAHPCPVTDVF